MWVGSERSTLCTLANEEPDTLVDNAPLTGYEPKFFDDYHFSETTEFSSKLAPGGGGDGDGDGDGRDGDDERMMVMKKTHRSNNDDDDTHYRWVQRSGTSSRDDQTLRFGRVKTVFAL